MDTLDDFEVHMSKITTLYYYIIHLSFPMLH